VSTEPLDRLQELLAGQYDIERELGRGGMGIVYLARDVRLDRLVAIKVLPRTHGTNPELRERFLREARTAAQLSHPNIVPIYRADEVDGLAFFTMGFVDGENIADRLRARGPFAPAEAVRVLREAAWALAYAHARGVVHRDVKPENIMIDGAGTAKIIDFGSTRVAGLLEMNASNDPALILGTEQYSAPEYFLGEYGTSASDIFSLGVIAYQMLTGKLPYGTRVPRCRTRAAQRKLGYVSARDEKRLIPAWVDEAIRKAVHPDPARRYGELSEFVYDLQHPNQAFLNKARPPLMERNPVMFWKVVSLFLAVALIVVLYRHPAAT